MSTTGSLLQNIERLVILRALRGVLNYLLIFRSLAALERPVNDGMNNEKPLRRAGVKKLPLDGASKIKDPKSPGWDRDWDGETSNRVRCFTEG